MVKHSAKKSKNRENSVFFLIMQLSKVVRTLMALGTGQNCTREQNCTKTILHQESILHELQFCTEGLFFTGVKKKNYSPRVMVMGNSDSRNKNKKLTYKINY